MIGEYFMNTCFKNHFEGGRSTNRKERSGEDRGRQEVFGGEIHQENGVHHICQGGLLVSPG